MAVVVQLGRMDYESCWTIQKKLVQKRINQEIPDTLLLVEHDPVISLGAGYHEENLLLPREKFEELGITLIKTDRGGDVTYHGPRQLVIYPIFHVKELRLNLDQWLRSLEQIIIEVLNNFGLQGYRFPPHTGVWCQEKKVAAIGIKVTRWVSLHGIALNCNNDLSPFQLIVPCGIKEYAVTSLTELIGEEVGIERATPLVIQSFQNVFKTSFPIARLEELVA